MEMTVALGVCVGVWVCGCVWVCVCVWVCGDELRACRGWNWNGGAIVGAERSRQAFMGGRSLYNCRPDDH